MKIKVSELEDARLDMWVAKALGWKQAAYGDRVVWVQADGEGRFRCNFNEWNPSTDWAQGGPIIEDNAITVTPISDAEWQAEEHITFYRARGFGYLEAAMRCYVASKFGGEFEA